LGGCIGWGSLARCKKMKSEEIEEQRLGILRKWDSRVELGIFWTVQIASGYFVIRLINMATDRYDDSGGWIGFLGLVGLGQFIWRLGKWASQAPPIPEHVKKQIQVWATVLCLLLATVIMAIWGSGR
jgi:hypothetical protein